MGHLKALIDTYESPHGKKPAEFAAYQKGFNDALLSRARSHLETKGLRSKIKDIVQKHSAKPDYALLVTGSDGRREKSIASPIELMIAVEGNGDIKALGEEVETTVLEELGTNGDSSLFCVKDVEIKNAIGSDLAMFSKKPGLVMPSRLLDSSIVIGNEDVVFLAKRNMAREFQGEQATRIMDGLRGRLNVSRKICRTGANRFQGEDLQYFSPETGEIWYNPNKSIHGVKPGPLRLVQWRLGISMVRSVRKTDLEHAERLVMDAPANIVDRMSFLQHEGVLRATFKEITDLSSLYQYFLLKYGISEYESAKNNAIRTQTDAAEFRDALKELLALDEKLSKFAQ